MNPSLQQTHELFETGDLTNYTIPTPAEHLIKQDDFGDNDTLRLWWRHVLQIPLLTQSREVELAKRIEAGDEFAYQEMVESNLRLVANIARRCRRYAGNILTLEDLIQEGCVGLMRAARKFDYRRGYKFSTYASYWIRQAIFRSIAEQGRSIRLPVHMVESISRTDRARAILTQQMQRPPSTTELSAHLHLPEKKVVDIVDCVSDPVSLDVYVGEDDDATLMDLVEDVHSKTPMEKASLHALRDEVKRALLNLPAREAEVLSLRYGLKDGSNSLTLDEVGEALNLTRERIRQIEKMALNRLKTVAPLFEIAVNAAELPESECVVNAA